MDSGNPQRVTNRELKSTCLTWVGLYFLSVFVLALCFLIFFPEAPPNTTPRLPPLPYRVILAFGAGLIGAIPGILTLGLLDGMRTRLKERASVLKATAGSLPADGRYQTFYGRILATGPMLTAPLTGRTCLLYQYKVTEGTDTRGSMEVTYAEGYALTPSYLESPSGRILLNAYMEPEFPAERVDMDEGRKRMSAYLTAAKTVSLSTWGLKDNYRKIREHLWGDSDGAIRFDSGLPERAAEATNFSEQIVQHGDEVAVFGFYSAAQGGIVPDPDEEILHMARLRKGSLSQLTGGFVRQAMVSASAAIFFAAIFLGWIYWFFRNAAEFTL